MFGALGDRIKPIDILKAYPYVEEADIYEALAYAAWRVEESVLNQYCSVKTRDAMNRRQDNNQYFVLTAIYRRFVI
jgi:Protein of unknown function (DUF433)